MRFLLAPPKSFVSKWCVQSLGRATAVIDNDHDGGNVTMMVKVMAIILKMKMMV